MLCVLVVSCLLGYSGISYAQDGDNGSSGGESGIVGASQNMAARMQQHVREIQAVLSKAELDRSDGKFSEAYVGYATALKSTPTVPATAELRRTIFSRYQVGAMDYARQLAGVGQINDAETVMNRVLGDARSMNLDPSTIKPEFRALMGQLRDPEIYNPANTAMHQRKVENVSKALKNAEGAIRLGEFDKAHDLYIYVLNNDPYNESAARGLELVNRKILEYQETAHDQTRASFMRQVEQGWESPVPPSLTADDVTGQWSGYDTGVSTSQNIENKLKNIIIPSVQFDGAPLRDVLNFLVGKSGELDSEETDPTRRGVNIVIDSSSSGGENLGDRQVTIKLSRVPLGEVLRYVTGQVQLKYRVDPFAITVVPLTASNDAALVTRKFLVPPDFIQGDGGGGGAAEPIDPFAAQAPAAGGLVGRVTAEDFLKSRNVAFPPGASATFIPGSNSLIVHNTPDAISLVESMVVAARSQGSKMVMVDFRMISISQLDLEELSFDWLLSPFNVDAGARTFAGAGTAGNQAARAVTDFPFQTPGTGAPIGSNLLTSGLRTGDVKTTISIEDVLARTTAAPPSTVAPGVFGLANVFGDPAFQAVWRGLDQAKGLDRLCESKVLVKPGQTASIRSVREFIFPTEYDPPEVPNDTSGPSLITLDIFGNIVDIQTADGFAVTPAHPTAFEMRELGKVMEVQPLVDDDNISVNLTVSVDISEFLGFINYGTPISQLAGGLLGAAGLQTQTSEVTPNRILQPVFEAVTETTNIQIYDGQTILIGGFLGDSVTDVEDSVPGLGDLPVVGRLFQSSVEDRSAKAIMLFVGVRLVDPAGVPINQDLSKLGQAQ